jgi:multiple sugar transport system substrate-binding protein
LNNTATRAFVQLLLVFSLLFLQLSCTKPSTTHSELLYWCSNNKREIDFNAAITSEWNKAHPDHTIHLQPVPEGQTSEEVILAAVVGKTTPDIYANMWQGNVEMYAKAGALIALDTLDGFMDFIRDRCDTAVIKEITSANGHIYQVPWKVNPIMTIYNKNIFSKSGINELPQTYTDYRAAAARFKQYNSENQQLHNWFGYTEVKPIWYERLFGFYPLYLAASNGAPLIVNNKAAFNNEYAVEVFTFLQSLYNDGFFARERLSTASDPFVQQQIATKWTGPWEITYLTNTTDLGFDFDFYPPIVPDNHKGPIYTYADPKNMVIFSTCEQPQQAWDFMKTLVDKKGDLQLLEITGQFPRRKNLQSDPFFNDYFSKNPRMVTFAKEVPYVKGIDNCEVIVEVLDILSQEYESCVIYGKKPPAQAVADAAAAVDVLLGSIN